jgi:hypothetical protein
LSINNDREYAKYDVPVRIITTRCTTNHYMEIIRKRIQISFFALVLLNRSISLSYSQFRLNQTIIFMKKYYALLTGAVLVGAFQTQAQTKIGGTGAPDSSAMLEVTGGTGNNKGILLPRISLTSISTWGLSGSTPVAGMFVYNTNASVTGGSGVGTYYWDGTQWVKSTSASTSGWDLTGNAGTNSATNFIGTTDSQALVFRTNGTEKARIAPNGKVGIGVSAPVAKLDIRSGDFGAYNGMRLEDNSDSNAVQANMTPGYKMGIPAPISFTFDLSGVIGDWVFGDHVVPGQTSGINLGSTNLRWDTAYTNNINASNTALIGGTGAPDVSAILEIRGGTGNNKGILPPRLTTTQRNAITSPAKALMIYNTTTNQLQVNTGTPAAPIWEVTNQTNVWNTTGNTGTNPATNFIGTGDAQPLVIRTNAVEHMRITSGGNVGINNGAPLSPLSFASTIEPKISFWDGGSTTNHFGFGLSNGQLNYHVTPGSLHAFYAGGKNGDGTELMRIQSNGNVGINNANPLSPLSFASALEPKISFWDGGSTTNHYGIGLSNGQLNYHVTPGSIHAFYAGGKNGDGTELMRIQGNGNVGIGTIAPAQTLHVQGTARISTATGTPTTIAGRNAAGDVGNVTLGSGLALTGGVLTATPVADNADWDLTGNTGTNPATNFIGTGDAQPLVIRTNAVEHMRITSGGNVGINNGTPLSPLSFQSAIEPKISFWDGGNATDYYGIGLSNDQLNYHVMPGARHAFYAGGKNGDGTELMRIQSNGNVGINNAAPLSPLSFASAIGPKISFYDGGNTTDHFGLGVSNGQLNYHVTPGSLHAFYAGGKNGDGTELMRIQGNGNVGIGTIAPAQTLHVQGTARISTATGTPTTIAGRNAAGDVGNVTLGSGLALTGGVLTATPVADNADWDLTGNTGTNPATNFIGTGDAQPLVIRTNAVEHMRITSGGNVGINNGTPLSPLSFQSAIEPKISFWDGGNTTDHFGFGVSNGQLNYHVTPGATHAFYAGGKNGDGTELMRIQSNGRVGIGTQNPSSKLAVNEGSINVLNTDPISSPAIEVINDGGGPIHSDDIRIRSYGNSTSPALNMFSARGTAAAPLNTQSGDILAAFKGFGQVNGTMNDLATIRMVYVGDGTTPKTRMIFSTDGVGNAGSIVIDSSGYVGIGTSNPTQRLHVNGNVLAASYLTSSDRRLKTNISDMQNGLSTIMTLRPVTYDKKRNISDNNYDRHEIGFIAQEVQKVLPSVVIENEDADKTLAVSYTELIPVLTKAIQEQQAKIESQDQKINALVAENQKLKGNEAVTAQLMERVKQMEQMMGINEIEGTSKVAGK